ncbi:hypothetical protein SESBI_30483 [Sesbania bispinosa]|nr:hypothetical protein SESBI_30483 [Sesbania bispinosa]
MLGLPMREDNTVYFHADHYPSDAKLTEHIAELLDLQPKQLKLGHPNSQGLTRSVLETLMSNLVKREEWHTLSRVLALTIYWQVLVLSALNIVDQIAIDVFFTVETKGRNPMPALLAETFLTLTFCQQKRKCKIRCCVQLLYVWIATHLFAGSRLSHSTSPLKGLKGIHIQPRNEHDWGMEFEGARKELFRWICSWLEQIRNEEVIFSCGDFPNVPLMGPRGCITYTPTIVIKQLGRTQYEPLKKQIGGCYFWYKYDDDTRTLLRKVKEAWMSVHRKGKEQLGKPLLADNPEYKAWHKAMRMMSNASEENFKSRKELNQQGKIIEDYKNAQFNQDQAMKVYQQYKDLFVRAANTTNTWIDGASNWEAETTKWKRKYNRLVDKLNIHALEFVRHFKKAEEGILSKPMVDLPLEVNDFMHVCGNFAKGLKRKKTMFLTYQDNAN